MRPQARSNHRGGYHPPWISLGIALLAIGIYLVAGPAAPTLVYHDEALIQGQWWRTFSAHLVHSDAGHLIWDTGALVLLGGLFERHLRGLLPVLLLGTALIIDAWLYFLMPEFSAYCGLSGVLNALLGAGLLLLWRETRSPWPIVAAMSALAKIAWEWRQGEALFTHTAWAAVPEIHAVGLFSGLCFALTMLAIRGCTSPHTHGITKPSPVFTTYTAALPPLRSKPDPGLSAVTINARFASIYLPGCASTTHAALDRQTIKRV